MRRTFLVLAASVGLVAGALVATASPAVAGTLETNGVVVSWDDSAMYAPAKGAFDSKDYKFQYANNSAFEVLTLKLTLTDKFGDDVASPDSDLFVKPGGTGFLDLSYVTYSKLTEGLGPYTLTLRVEFYPSSGLSASEVKAPFKFVSRAAPAPAKTVKCINKETLKIKTFKGTKCPAGWKKI